MRPRPDWFNSAVDPVLEFLDDHEIAVPSGVIVLAFDESTSDYPARRTVIRAIKQLEEHGLVERHPEKESYFQITDRGRAYLAGELTAEQLE